MDNEKETTDFQFKSGNDQKLSLMGSQLKDIFGKNDFNLRPGAISQGQSGRIFCKMSQNQALEIRIRNLDNPLTAILHFKFDKLIFLGIMNSNVASLQWLSFIQMPNLQSLSLDFNRISSFRGMIKTNQLKSLLSLKMSQNNLNTLSNLNRYKFPQKSGLRLQLDYMRDDKYCQFIDQLIKLNACNLSQLIILRRNRIQRPKFLQALKEKHHNHLSIRN